MLFIYLLPTEIDIAYWLINILKEKIILLLNIFDHTK